jgi:Sulfotransferase family
MRASFSSSLDSNRSAMSGDLAATKTKPATLPPPIIVLGSRPNSVAVVGAMLGCNSAAFALPQINLFVGETLEDVVTEGVDRGPTHIHGLLRALAYIYGCEQTIISIGMARRWVMRRLSWSTSQVFDELRARVAPRRLIDKSAIYSQDDKCLERIRKASPDAYYVNVVEHPLSLGTTTPGRQTATLNGRRRRAHAKNPAPNQLRWLHAQQLIADATKDIAPGRFAVVRMERLLADPRAEMSSLCAQLDLPNDDTAVTDMLHPERSPFAGFGPVGANLGDDPSFLRDPIFPPKSLLNLAVLSQQTKENMLSEVARVAARYGYD